MYKLGIDVGGTHVDFAVINQGDELLYATKVLADDNLSICIERGIRNLLDENQVDPHHMTAVHLGTTLAVNSLLERKSLYKVGLIRLAGHAPDLPPAYQWPTVDRQYILAGYRTVAGGREYNNAALSSFDKEELLRSVNELLEEGAESIAIVGVFSPFYAEDEKEAESLIAENFANLPISLSYQVGSLGYITRENTTILNATLKKVMKEGFQGLQRVFDKLGIKGDCYITENNGTLLTLDEAMLFPVRTISSGPTNSIVGASRLANCKDGIVVDIGGTSTDIGIIQNGLPLYSLMGGQIAGISCQLQMPDVISLAMGGGSLVKLIDDQFQIGPESLGATLLQQCRSMGGNCLTLYDIGQVLKNNQIIEGLSVSEAKQIMQLYLQQVFDEIERLLPDVSDVPILLVGGGSTNIPDDMLDERFIRPPYYQVANAYGAALSEVAGKIDCIVEFKQEPEVELEIMVEQAKQIAIKNGARLEHLKVIEKKVLPLYYMPEPRHRVIITVAGRI